MLVDIVPKAKIAKSTNIIRFKVVSPFVVIDSEFSGGVFLLALLSSLVSTSLAGLPIPDVLWHTEPD